MAESSTQKLKITVFGAGSYGTALATVAARRGHDTVLFARNEETCNSINSEHKNPKRLSSYTLPPNLSACSDMKQACEGANLLIHAIPAQNTFDFLTLHRDNIPSNIPLVSTSKGIYTKTLQMMSEVIPEALGRAQPLAYLSGPSFAKDMMENSGSIAVVVASEDQEIAKFVAESLSSTDFRCYRTDDVIGVEVGGALKNPLAIMSGMLQGSGAGPSTSAAMITRGCEEMRQLAIAMGGRPETLAGLSGIGDLILTASSSLSRNFTVGFRVAKGETLEQIIESMGEVAEGVPTTTIVPQLLEKYNLDLPIFLTTQRVLAGELNFEQAKEAVMNRPLKREDGRED